MAEKREVGVFLLCSISALASQPWPGLYPSSAAAPPGLQFSLAENISSFASCYYWPLGASTTFLGSLHPNPFVNISSVESSESKSVLPEH